MADATFPRVAQGGQVPLVGRTSEIAWLRGLLQKASDGEARVVLIEGESGVGKSRMLREFLRGADDAGWQTLWGRYTAEPAPADAVFHSTLAEQARRGGLLSATDDAELQRTEAEPLRRAETFARLAETLAERRPLVLVLDDLHLAESTAVSLFCEFARCIADAARTRPVRLLLLAALHPQLPGDILGEALDRLRREAITASLALHGLDEPEVAEVLRHSFHGRCQPPLIDAVHRASQGNPFFVLQLASTLLARDQLVEEESRYRTRTPAGELVLPVTAPEAIRTRIESLSPEVLRILQTASLLGDEFDLEDLAAACAPADPGRAIDEAVGRGLVEERGRLFAFHHHLVRHAFVQSLGPVERRTAHRRIAEALLERFGDGPDHLVPIGLHLLDADGAGRDPIELGRLYERAGDAAMTVFARAVALRLYEASLATAPYVATLTKPELGWLQCRTARVNDNTGNRPRARELYFGGMQNLRGSTDYEAWGLAVLGWERTFTISSEPIPTDEYEREFAEASGEAGRDLRIRLLTQRADALQLARDPTDLEVARQAVELAEGSELAETRAAAFATMGLVQMRHLNAAEGLRWFEIAAEAGAQDPNPVYSEWGRIRSAWPLILMGDPAEAARSAQESSERARRSNYWPGAALASALHYSAATLRCEPGFNGSPSEPLLLIARSNYRQASFILDGAVAWDRLMRGALDEAADAAAGWERIAGRIGARSLRALVDVSRGAEKSVLAQFAERPWRAPVRGEIDFLSLGPLCASAELAAAIGAEEIADRVYGLLEPLSERGLRFSLAPPMLLERVLGLSARVSGRLGQAAEHLRRAEDIAVESGAPTELALVKLEQALLASDRGDRGAPVEVPAAEALRYFHANDLAWLAERARNLIPGSSENGQRFPVNDHELSPIELDVLALYASAETPARIAQRLLLSERTVSEHLARATRRLAITSPDDAARLVGSPVQPQPTRPELDELTRREKEVLQLIALGKTNAQIAEELVISQHTAIRHVANILEKTGCANRTEAARLVD